MRQAVDIINGINPFKNQDEFVEYNVVKKDDKVIVEFEEPIRELPRSWSKELAAQGFYISTHSEDHKKWEIKKFPEDFSKENMQNPQMVEKIQEISENFEEVYSVQRASLSKVCVKTNVMPISEQLTKELAKEGFFIIGSPLANAPGKPYSFENKKDAEDGIWTT